MSKLTFQGNPQYRDRLFRLLFGSEEYKDNIASLCSALCDEEYTADDIEEINTIEDVIYIKMKNDVSFLINSFMFLWEQQSTINPNMPLRGFMYFGELYSSYVTTRGLNIYGTGLVRIPTPRYIVFYNGTVDAPEVSNFRLSDAFINEDETKGFEWTATMYNINRGKNRELFRKCRPLEEYMILVDSIREYQGMGYILSRAADMAVAKCIEEGVLVDFLMKHRAEVKKMLITDPEYNEAMFKRMCEEAGREMGLKEGREEGLKEGRETGLKEGRETGLKEGKMELVNIMIQNCIKEGKDETEISNLLCSMLSLTTEEADEYLSCY